MNDVAVKLEILPTCAGKDEYSGLLKLHTDLVTDSTSKVSDEASKILKRGASFRSIWNYDTEHFAKNNKITGINTSGNWTELEGNSGGHRAYLTDYQGPGVSETGQEYFSRRPFSGRIHRGFASWYECRGHLVQSARIWGTLCVHGISAGAPRARHTRATEEEEAVGQQRERETCQIANAAIYHAKATNLQRQWTPSLRGEFRVLSRGLSFSPLLSSAPREQSCTAKRTDA